MAILKNFKLTTFTILVIICLVAPHAGAESFGPGNHFRNLGGGLAGLKTFIELNLSETQKTAVLSIMDKYQDKRQGTRENLREARENLRNALKSEPFNEDGVRTVYRQVSLIQEDLLVLRVQMRSELKALLTPEQSELLKEKRERRFAK
ncbi:MAG TPA: Spy/CpxP family protein refolding chaperone [Deltaproteobacteria bacterium]|nr:Spy/CpxP family protein refolding chaperone [Deltaproteobacteria bacterium]